MQALRGQRKIFNHLLFPEQEQPALKVVERKGRSERLKNLQNELIIARYWYYIKLQRLQYQDALETLEKEMFLAQLTIIRIIDAGVEQLRSYQQGKPEVKFFKEKYPWLVW